jgi:hypothetical protein
MKCGPVIRCFGLHRGGRSGIGIGRSCGLDGRVVFGSSGGRCGHGRRVKRRGPWIQDAQRFAGGLRLVGVGHLHLEAHVAGDGRVENAAGTDLIGIQLDVLTAVSVGDGEHYFAGALDHRKVAVPGEQHAARSPLYAQGERRRVLLCGGGRPVHAVHQSGIDNQSAASEHEHADGRGHQKTELFVFLRGDWQMNFSVWCCNGRAGNVRFGGSSRLGGGFLFVVLLCRGRCRLRFGRPGAGASTPASMRSGGGVLGAGGAGGAGASTRSTTMGGRVGGATTGSGAISRREAMGTIWALDCGLGGRAGCAAVGAAGEAEETLVSGLSLPRKRASSEERKGNSRWLFSPLNFPF